MALIRYLLSMRGRRLWQYEECGLKRPELPSAAALASLVNSVTGAMHFETGLRVRQGAGADRQRVLVQVTGLAGQLGHWHDAL